jgi:uncharacterized protein with GYD domain
MRFALLGTITSYGAQKYKERGPAAKKMAEKLGIKVEWIYYTQGPYDFVEVVDAPSAEAVLALSTWFAKAGYGKLEAMPGHDVPAMKRADAKAGR